MKTRDALHSMTHMFLALFMAVFATSHAWADFTMTNPVTGENQSYTWKYVGTDGVWNSNSNWKDSSDNVPQDNKVPGITSVGVWDPFFFANNISVTAEGTNSGYVEGWNFRIGIFNGANVSIAKLNKLQGGQRMFMSVDNTSKLTINDWGGGSVNTGGDDNTMNLDYFVASSKGVTYTVDVTTPATAKGNMHYYFAGEGSVCYKSLGICNHYIKRADVTLTHPNTKQRRYKKLVSFTSSTKTFKTASDSVVYVDGTETNFSAQDLPTAVSITTADNVVGTCQLVQRNDNPTGDDGEGNGVYLYYIDGPHYTAAVTGASAVWSTKAGLTSADTWENGAGKTIALVNQTDGATVTLDADITAHLLVVCSDDEKGLTLAKNEAATLSFDAYDFTDAGGRVTVGFSTGAAPVLAGENTVLTQLGTGEILVGAGKKLTLTGAARGWAESSIAVADGGELVIGGDDTLTSVPFNTRVASVAGVVSYAATIDTGASGMEFANAINRDFVDGANITATRFVNGNESGSPVQVFNQRGGTITVTGTGDVTAASPTGVAPVLFAHWPSTVTYNLLGGSLTAVSGVNGSIYFARDGNAKLSIGGGATTATLKTNGLVDDSRCSKDKTNTFIEILSNGVFEIGSFGITMYDSREPFSLSGGTLNAYESASVSVAHANGVAVTANSVLAAKTGETLTIASALTGSGNLTIGTAEDTGTVDISSATITATGTFTVTAGSTLVIPASTAETTYTVSGAGTVKVVLTDEQLESVEPAVLGVKASDFTGSIVCVDGNGDVDAEHTGSVENGKITIRVASTYTVLVWNATGWVKQDDGTPATPDANSILVLRDEDVITLSADLAPYAVHMPQSGTVAITGYRYLDVSTLQIPEDAVLRLVVDHNAAIGDDVVKSTLAFTGAGNVELWCSHSAPWVNGMPVVDANFADGFTGRLVIARGQYGASTALKSSLDIGVIDGGNLQLKGGTWNNHFYLSGDGWNTNGGEHDKVSLRADANRVGNSATLEFVTDESGKKGSIGSYLGYTFEIGCALVGTDGFRMGSGTIKLTAPTNQTSRLTGKVVVSGGTLVFGTGNYTTSNPFTLGTEVRVDSGAQLTWHTRTNTDTGYSETNKGKIGTAITLNGGTLHLEDGSYVFTEDFTVAANSTLSTKWGKGRIFKSLKGDAGVTLTVNFHNNSDTGNSQNYVAGGDFAGTIDIATADGSGDALFVPIGTALQNATVNLGGSRAYVKLIGDATIGALTGSQAVFGDGSPRTLTLKGGTYSGQLKDQADGAADSTKALSLVVAGDVTLADVGTYSGNATLLQYGSLTVPSLYSDGKVVPSGFEYMIRIRTNETSYETSYTYYTMERVGTIFSVY